ncbi:MAG: hypothetical protein ACJA2J_002029 [Candidatus Azotimanducaceae bacterium]
MLSATEFYIVPFSLAVILWIEVVIYLGLGTYELFDDFLAKPKPWMIIFGRINGYVRMTHKIGHKMHAGICFLLGFVALNGAVEGQVTRFELELIFLSFGILMPAIWSSLLPGRLALIILATKPEFWLQIAMLTLFSHLIRPEVLLLCVVLNVWGIFVYFSHTRKTLFVPFTYATLRSHCIDAEGAAFVHKLDKLAGYSADAETLKSDT